MKRQVEKQLVFGLVEDGIQRADEHANDEWKEAAMDAVRRAAMHNPEITTDEVWSVLGKDTELTHNLSAMGPVMRRAAKEGIIEGTDSFRASRCTGSQGGRGTAGKPIRLWRSLVFSKVEIECQPSA